QRIEHSTRQPCQRHNQSDSHGRVSVAALLHPVSQSTTSDDTKRAGDRHDQAINLSRLRLSPSVIAYEESRNPCATPVGRERQHREAHVVAHECAPILFDISDHLVHWNLRYSRLAVRSLQHLDTASNRLSYRKHQQRQKHTRKTDDEEHYLPGSRRTD